MARMLEKTENMENIVEKKSPKRPFSEKRRSNQNKSISLFVNIVSKLTGNLFSKELFNSDIIRFSKSSSLGPISCNFEMFFGVPAYVVVNTCYTHMFSQDTFNRSPNVTKISDSFLRRVVYKVEFNQLSKELVNSDLIRGSKVVLLEFFL